MIKVLKKAFQNKMPSSPESWSETLKGVSAALAIIAAIVGAIGFWNAQKALAEKKTESKRKDEAFERFKLESQTAVAVADAKGDEAKKRAAIANEEAARANLEAAKANERAEALAKEAAASNLELERIRKKIAWRTVSLDEAEVFKNAVRQAPKSGKITVEHAMDPEAKSFAEAIIKLLREAGYTLRPEEVSVNLIGNRPSGLILGVRDENSAMVASLLRGLRSAKIDVTAAHVPELREDLKIVIGNKPDIQN